MFNRFTKFEKAIVKNNFSVDTCLMFLLAWIESHRARPNYQHFKNFSALYKYKQDSEIIVELAQTARVEDLQLCLEILTELESAERAIVMQIICAYLRGENEINDDRGYIIKFLADTLKITEDNLGVYLAGISNCTITTGMAAAGPELERRRGIYLWRGKLLNAYDLLDVSPTAAPEALKAQYQKQIRLCHPDRFATQGAKKIQEMAEKFKQLQAAYRHLTSS